MLEVSICKGSNWRQFKFLIEVMRGEGMYSGVTNSRGPSNNSAVNGFVLLMDSSENNLNSNAFRYPQWATTHTPPCLSYLPGLLKAFEITTPSSWSLNPLQVWIMSFIQMFIVCWVLWEMLYDREPDSITAHEKPAVRACRRGVVFPDLIGRGMQGFNSRRSH